MAVNDQEGRRDRRGPDGQRHRPCLRAGGLFAWCSTTSSGDRIKAGAGDHQRQHGAPGRQQAHHRGRPQSRARRASRRRRSYDALVGLRSRDREPRPRRKRSSARSFAELCAVAEAGSHRRHQHLVDLDHAAGRRRPTGRSVHRHSFHESGAADGAGRADPRHRHRRRDLRDRQGVRHASSARPSRCRRISRPSSSTASCCR